jgi:hypothetical protein
MSGTVPEKTHHTGHTNGRTGIKGAVKPCILQSVAVESTNDMVLTGSTGIVIRVSGSEMPTISNSVKVQAELRISITKKNHVN